MNIVLASASPRRRALLDQIGLSYETFPVNVSESMDQTTDAETLVCANAAAKADAALAFVMPGTLIIGADTVVAIDGKFLGKPIDTDGAADMLRTLSGRVHTVYTGVCLILAAPNSEDCNRRAFAEKARVWIRDIHDDELKAYIRTAEPLDKAGGYAAQGLGSVFVERIEGDYTTVVGLPLSRLWSEIRAMGVDVISCWL